MQPNIQRICAALCCVLLCLPVAAAPRLKLTENRRYLQYEDGKPFFYLGDTAWELFHRLNREEAALYLNNRAGTKPSIIPAHFKCATSGVYSKRCLSPNSSPINALF